MPTIVTFTPLKTPQRMSVSEKGRSLLHDCRDANGKPYRQRLALGSVRGIFYLDALCLHCGAHFVWVEDNESAPLDTFGEKTEEPA